MKKIIRNAAECPKCHDVIESKHRHDFKSCKCGAIFVDGGREYIRRGWSEGVDEPIDHSKYEETDDEQDVLTSEEPW